MPLLKKSRETRVMMFGTIEDTGLSREKKEEREGEGEGERER